MSNERNVLVLPGDGSIKVQQEAVPAVTRGTVKIQTVCSLVSPGTELKGWDNLSRQRKEPQLSENPRKFGYSMAT
ncbi:MAG: hypothetical protein R3Y36_02330, partial [Spirochaetales bacterium]